MHRNYHQTCSNIRTASGVRLMEKLKLQHLHNWSVSQIVIIEVSRLECGWAGNIAAQWVAANEGSLSRGREMLGGITAKKVRERLVSVLIFFSILLNSYVQKMVALPNNIAFLNTMKIVSINSSHPLPLMYNGSCPRFHSLNSRGGHEANQFLRHSFNLHWQTIDWCTIYLPEVLLFEKELVVASWRGVCVCVCSIGPSTRYTQAMYSKRMSLSKEPESVQALCIETILKPHQKSFKERWGPGRHRPTWLGPISDLVKLSWSLG